MSKDYKEGYRKGFVDGYREAEKKDLELPTGSPLYNPSTTFTNIPSEDYCLHKNCSGCKSGTCSGVHGLVCRCKSCGVIA